MNIIGMINNICNICNNKLKDNEQDVCKSCDKLSDNDDDICNNCDELSDNDEDICNDCYKLRDNEDDICKECHDKLKNHINDLCNNCYYNLVDGKKNGLCNYCNDKLMDMLDELEDFWEDNKIKYLPELKNSSIENVYNLFKNNIMYEPTDADDSIYIGLYYKYFTNHIDKSVEYFLNAAKIGNNYTKNTAYVNIGMCYEQMNYLVRSREQIEERCNKSKEYFLMALEVNKKDAIAMYKLAKYYYYNTRDETNAIKYFLMSAKNHHDKTIIGFIESNWYPLKYIITIEWFTIFVENQDILKINDIYYAFMLLIQKNIDKEKKRII